MAATTECDLPPCHS